jgi:hypothetical protein
MSIPISVHPVDMTPALMQKLEDHGLIIRLAPGRHMMPAQEGDAIGETVYASSEDLGPHKLLSVTINSHSLSRFGTHPDNEEFLLIGEPDAKPMYLVISWHMKNELARRIGSHELSEQDFVCLRVVYNDPQVSFFTMLKDVPHGEAVVGSKGKPATFYVTESRDMSLELTAFADYELRIVT